CLATEPGQGTVGAGLAGDSCRAPCTPMRSPAGRLLQGFCLATEPGQGTVGAGLAGDSCRAPCMPMQSPAGRLLQRLCFASELGNGTVGAGLAGDSLRRRARRCNRLQAGSYSGLVLPRRLGTALWAPAVLGVR